MGLRFRKSMNFGPFRVNFSKSGVGYSVGGKGFRYTKKANGGTRTTVSIPGTGVSYVKDYSDERKPSGGSPSAPGPSGGKKRPKPWLYVAAAVLVIGIGGAAFGGCSSGDVSEPSASISEGSSASSVGGSSVLQPQDTEQDQPQDTEPEQSQNTEPEQPQDAELEQPDGTTPPAEETPAQPAAEEQAEQEPEQPQDPEPELPDKTTPPAEETPTQPAASEEPTEQEPEQQSRTVYITPTGKRYHYDGSCNGGTYIESTLDEALSLGLTPCKKCAGG